MNITWNAQDYAAHFTFVHEYGQDVLSLVEAGDGGLAVDLGCGNGALTAALAAKGYRVRGIDASGEMLAIAGKNHPDLAFYQDDALTFALEEKADVIFSNAVFHWIDGEQQDRLAANLAAQLKSGGQLICEFGGQGCAETVHAALERAFAERGLTYPRTFFFPTIGEYAPILERNGFLVEFAALFERPTVQQSPENGLRDWINMFVTKPFEGMESELKEGILQEAQERVRDRLFQDGKWVIDYVRIRIKARRK
ncbi:MAG: methyltransferase domain-containing protein [Eubacteriales bacterium]|nr:methyltransferase domain-containing protein [Eubacteriales bacterium]